MAVFLSFSRRITFAFTLFSLPENKVNVFARVGGKRAVKIWSGVMGYILKVTLYILSYFVQPVGMKDFSVLFNTRKMARVLQAFDQVWSILDISDPKKKNQK